MSVVDMGKGGGSYRFGQNGDDVVAEIARRAAAGHALNSGANRGDWLYAAAVRFFGSWGAAVEAAGFAYGDVKRVALDAEALLNEIAQLAAVGDPLFAGDHLRERHAAMRHFGSWKAAVEAAGCAVPSRATWTAQRIVEQIQDDLRRGLRVYATAVIERNGAIYKAARRYFGSWGAALAAAGAPATEMRRRGRPPKTQRR